MTTAFQEPYALVLKGHGTLNSFSHNGVQYHRLPKGSNTLMVTTTSPGEININTTPTASLSDRVLVGTIPAGSGRRSTTVTGLGVAEDEDLHIIIQRVGGVAPVTERCVVNVVTIPLRGAGGGSLRKVLGAAHRLVTGWAK